MSSWLGTSLSSHHWASMSICCVPLDPLGEGSGVEVHWGPSSSPLPARGTSPPPKNSSMVGARGGRHSRSSSPGLDHLDGSPVASLSLQVGIWGSSVLVSSSGLSSNVTCHLSYTGLGDWAHLLVGSPWGDATWGTLTW